MHHYKYFGILLFFSCSNTKPRKPIANYDKMWGSIDKLKKQRSFKVIKDKDRVVGYVDDEYVDKIFPQNKSIQQPHSETFHQPTSIRADKKMTKSKQTTINTDKVENSVKNSKEQIQAPKSLPEKTPVKNKVSEEKKIEIDFNKLNFYVSDFKSLSSKMKKSGSFKLNLKNTNEVDLPDNFFEKLICKVEVLEGGEVLLTNWKGGLNINNQKLISIKRTFSIDNNVSIKFSLKKDSSAKIKISFIVEGDPEKKIIVKNGLTEVLNL